MSQKRDIRDITGHKNCLMPRLFVKSIPDYFTPFFHLSHPLGTWDITILIIIIQENI